MSASFAKQNSVSKATPCDVWERENDMLKHADASEAEEIPYPKTFPLLAIGKNTGF